MSREGVSFAGSWRLWSAFAAAPVLAGVALALGHDPRAAEAARPLITRDADYVGAATCRTCHADHYASFRRTYHSTMTQLPSATSVLGRFDGASVSAYGSSATPFERDGRFFFELPAIRNEPAREAEVALLVGSRRYQQYFEKRTEGESVTYRRLPLLWHVAERRWLHLNGAFLEQDRDDWGAHAAMWNQNCIFCHNTGVEPDVVRDDRGLKEPVDSRVAELGISCEACHGPGRAHVEKYRSPTARYLAYFGVTQAEHIVHPVELGQMQSLAVCGQCHSQRLPDPKEKLALFLDEGPTFRPGDTLKGHVAPLTRDTPVPDPRVPNAYKERFWSDGTARLTSYEYLGVTQSPCMKDSRFTCNTCHTMHGGNVEGQITDAMRGDAACTQCHTEIAMNVAEHTHHPVKSSGSRCLDCHMPRMVYGILDVHRSHRVESPDVKRDVEGGRPNACTLCHLDRTAAWAADAMRRFWGDRYAAPERRPDGVSLDLPEALASLHAGDPLQRVTTVAAFGRDNAVKPELRGPLLAHLLVSLGDPYGSIRLISRRSALGVERTLDLGLADALSGFDPQAPPQRRNRTQLSLLRSFADAARKLPPPPGDVLLSSEFRLDIDAVGALLERQAASAIETGE